MFYLKFLSQLVVAISVTSINGELTIINDTPLVSTSAGDIQGYLAKTVNNKTFLAFDGIPYGHANRYEEATPVLHWDGVWNANTVYKCLQYYHYTEPGQDFVIGEEDCLYINVYVPKASQKEPYKVIVFIHGGAFMFNNGGTYGPKILLDNDVIYVSFNYRLGPLGFLSTEDNAIPSNLGLRDQLLALAWIKSNIAYFGGDSDSITLAGMSAGGASVHIMTLSPITRNKDIFKRALIQSGTAINSWVLVENSLSKARKLAALLGCPTDCNKSLVQCLQSRPAKQIVNAVKHFQPWLYNPFSPFAVVVDNWSENPILPEHPYKLMLDGNIADVPVIYSNVQAEGLYPGADFIGDTNNLNTIDENWNDLIPFILDFNNTVDPIERDQISHEIRKEYFKDGSVNVNTYKSLIQMITDRLFVYDIEKAARLHARKSKSTVHYYNYAYRAAHSKSEFRSKSNTNYGTSHGDDTICVLSSNVDCQSTETDRKMSRILQDIWLKFTAKVNNVVWTPISKYSVELDYLNINSPGDISMERAPFLGNRQFWDKLLLLENERLFKQKDEF